MNPTFSLPSPETGTTYRLFVDPPASGTAEGIVLFMDGDDQFQAAIAARRSVPEGSLPPLLLVGVGYGASYAKPANKRGRDYTPVAHSDEPTSGGADAFLRFLTDTLWPELLRRHGLPDSAARGIAGHSLGSLLVLHALFQAKPFFTHFLASAPSIWWAERAILCQAADLRASQAELPGRLFLGVGADDSASMTSDLALLERQLEARLFQRLHVSSTRFAGKDHYNVLPLAFATGLLSLFGSGIRTPPKVEA